MTARTDKGTLGYEQARDELIDVVRRLEAGGTTLEESLALWERGEELAKVCRRWLDGARARLDAALTERDEPGGQGAPGAARTTADSGSGSDGVSGDVGGGEAGPGR
ncbi:exodeoxyribonuclease VII small subunit [Streptomyces spongiicola]|uniref:Exodeoxyribonuclease 7 small subunit n=1 Tax=Streptomyces spongiicola TaxID=1690221 RepID=A0ABM6VB10_9ACTN|nr:exodeoxyribonuclease VII small subunit [Streptomyces spongiicola]AWK11200.1 exodeoxyribonuclease VII small subunit [Streptomyces spongiicola]